jgi:hypothetical protein
MGSKLHEIERSGGQKIYQLLHATILDHLSLEDNLALESATNMADIHYSLGQLEESDKLDWQVLRIRLIALGLRHADTLRFIRRIASLLKLTSRLLKSIRLFNIAL